MKYPLNPRTDDQRLKRSKKFWINQLTSPFRALPDFLIIGEMKSGTSSLFHYLTRHSMIVPPVRKEVHFFTAGYSKGLGWYRAHFPLKRRLREGAVTGEGCPGYLFAPGADERIYQVTPDARLIVILRNPVDRAISHYYHEIKMGREYLPLMEALEVEEDRLSESNINDREGLETYLHASYKLRGCYADTLARFFSIFDKKQILILGNNELLQDPQGTVNQACDFLSLPRITDDADFPRKNVGEKAPVSEEVISYLENYFKPHNERLFQLLGRQIDW